MRILVLGPRRDSWLGHALHLIGAEIAFGSRSTGCDVRNPNAVHRAVEEVRPDAIILGASLFPTPKSLGEIVDWEFIGSILTAKTLGMLAVLDAAVRCGTKTVIILGGSSVSSNPGMSHFTVANGALWSAVQFAARHTTLRAYYLELGVVLPSTTGEQYIATLPEDQRDTARHSAITPQMVAEKVSELIEGSMPSGTRVVLNHAQD